MMNKFDGDDDENVCPISFIPISELSHPVTFINMHQNVFELDAIAFWLQNCRLTNPVTGVAIAPDFAERILQPVYPPRTAVRLYGVGYLDGHGGWKVIFLIILKYSFLLKWIVV